MADKIRVLIVDDSILFRKTLSQGLNADPQIEVVDTASNPYEARDMILAYHPDVMTLDVEMPKMNGIEFLRKLMPQYPIRTVMVSAVDNKVFEALQVGAIDFVVKSNLASNQALELFMSELIDKIKTASTAILKETGPQYRDEKALVKPQNIGVRIIGIGASTGGPEATEQVIRRLPEGLPPIVIVQHMPPVFTRMYAERLNQHAKLTIKEAQTGDLLLPSHAYIAPGSDHLRLYDTPDGYRLKCFQAEKVNGHMPSVDVTFASIAKYFGSDSLGVILTGMGNDGAKGLLAMRQKGAHTIGQDPGSCVVYGMPKVAYDIGAVQNQIPLTGIADMIVKICGH